MHISILLSHENLLSKQIHKINPHTKFNIRQNIHTQTPNTFVLDVTPLLFLIFQFCKGQWPFALDESADLPHNTLGQYESGQRIFCSHESKARVNAPLNKYLCPSWWSLVPCHFPKSSGSGSLPSVRSRSRCRPRWRSGPVTQRVQTWNKQVLSLCLSLSARPSNHLGERTLKFKKYVCSSVCLFLPWLALKILSLCNN